MRYDNFAAAVKFALNVDIIFVDDQKGKCLAAAAAAAAAAVAAAAAAAAATAAAAAAAANAYKCIFMYVQIHKRCFICIH